MYLIRRVRATPYVTWTDALLGLVVALLVGALVRQVLPATSGIARKGILFETHPEMLLVRVTLFANATPVIDSVELLTQGRVTMTRPGPYGLELLDADGRVLFSQGFDVVFVEPGEPPLPVDRVQQLFVAPWSAEVRRVRVSSPSHGVAEAEVNTP